MLKMEPFNNGNFAKTGFVLDFFARHDQQDENINRCHLDIFFEKFV